MIFIDFYIALIGCLVSEEDELFVDSQWIEIAQVHSRCARISYVTMQKETHIIECMSCAHHTGADCGTSGRI